MQANPTLKRRKINVIQYSESCRRANLLTKRGKQTQTATLNINLKTINKNQLLKMPILSNQQKNIIAAYLVEKGNFLTTRKLFGAEKTSFSETSHKNILKYMHSFYEGSRFVQKVLQNENMDFSNKLILLKFAQKVRESAIDPKRHTNWKEKF